MLDKAEEQDYAIAVVMLQVLGHGGNRHGGPGAHQEVVEPHSILEGDQMVGFDAPSLGFGAYLLDGAAYHGTHEDDVLHRSL